MEFIFGMQCHFELRVQYVESSTYAEECGNKVIGSMDVPNFYELMF
jgi:hypothetical protein